MSEDQNDPVLEVGQRMFEKVAKSLSSAEGLRYMSSSIPFLMESSCCGYHKASYFLAVIFETGVGVPRNPIQVMYPLYLIISDEISYLQKQFTQ